MFLDKIVKCEEIEGHEKREGVEENESVCEELCFFASISTLFEEVQGNESESSKEREKGTTKKKSACLRTVGEEKKRKELNYHGRTLQKFLFS